jgi:hypothetical protein
MADLTRMDGSTAALALKVEPGPKEEISMVTLTSKSSAQIKFPGTPSTGVEVELHGSQTVTVETGVAVFALTGTNPHDWTRDTLTFPVGAPCPAGDYVSGIAAASPTSFWTPMGNIQGTSGGAVETGVDGNGNPVITNLPGSLIPPPIGVAIDSATVSYSVGDGQPIITMALAVFGNNCAMLRASYSAFIVTTSGGIIVGGGGVGTLGAAKKS